MDNMRYSRYRNIKKQNSTWSSFMVALFFVLVLVLGIKTSIANGQTNIQSIDTQTFKQVLSFSIPLIDTVYDSGRINTFKQDISSVIKSFTGIELYSPISMISSQFAYFSVLLKNNNLFESEENDTNNNQPEQSIYFESVSSAYFEEKEEKDLSDSDIISAGDIKIHNETGYSINIEKLLNEPLNVEFDRKGPKFLIYHTHTTESYLKTISELDKDVQVRSMDDMFNVVRVGDELSSLLKNKYGIEVLHNGTVHDYPDFNRSYVNAFSTLEKYKKSYPSIKLSIDIHRDATANGGKLRLVQNIDDVNAAKIMFVVGTDAYGLKHDKWQENLKLALKLQYILNESHLGIARHIYITKYRYNQNVTDLSLLVEVGGDGNLIDEAIISMKYLAMALGEVFKDN